MRVDECSDRRPKASRHRGCDWNGGNVVRPGFYIGRVVPRNSEHQSIFADRRDLKLKTETKVGLLFGAEKSKIADFRAGYASRADLRALGAEPETIVSTRICVEC